MAGPLLVREAARSGASILPVDSEHSAVFQCLRSEPPELGPPHPPHRVGRTVPHDAARGAGERDAGAGAAPSDLEHGREDHDRLGDAAQQGARGRRGALALRRLAPTRSASSSIRSRSSTRWSSSRTARCWPSSASPTWRCRSAFALAFPKRAATRHSYFDLARFKTLTFEEPDLERFPGLDLGFRAARLGGTAGAVLNAANEVAVAAFLKGALPFPRITSTVAATLDRVPHVAEPTLEQVLAADRAARTEAAACCS